MRSSGVGFVLVDALAVISQALRDRPLDAPLRAGVQEDGDANADNGNHQRRKRQPGWRQRTTSKVGAGASRPWYYLWGGGMQGKSATQV
jgi:hypothetical protein